MRRRSHGLFRDSHPGLRENVIGEALVRAARAGGPLCSCNNTDRHTLKSTVFDRDCKMCAEPTHICHTDATRKLGCIQALCYCVVWQQYDMYYVRRYFCNPKLNKNQRASCPLQSSACLRPTTIRSRCIKNFVCAAYCRMQLGTMNLEPRSYVVSMLRLDIGHCTGKCFTIILKLRLKKSSPVLNTATAVFVTQLLLRFLFFFRI